MTKTQDITNKTVTRSLQYIWRKIKTPKDRSGAMDNIQDSNHQARGSNTIFYFNILCTKSFQRINSYKNSQLHPTRYWNKNILTTRTPIPMDYNSYSNSQPLRFDSHSDPPLALFAKYYFSKPIFSLLLTSTTSSKPTISQVVTSLLN